MICWVDVRIITTCKFIFKRYGCIAKSCVIRTETITIIIFGSANAGSIANHHRSHFIILDGICQIGKVRIDLRGTDGLPTREGVGDLGVAQGAEQDQGCGEEVFHHVELSFNGGMVIVWR